MKSLIQIFLLFSLMTGLTRADTDPVKPHAQKAGESAAEIVFGAARTILKDEKCTNKMDILTALEPGFTEMAELLQLCDANLVSDDEVSRSAAYVCRQGINMLRGSDLLKNLAGEKQVEVHDKYEWKNDAEFNRLSKDPGYQTKRIPTYSAFMDRALAAREQREPDQEKFKTMINRLASPNKKPGFRPDKEGRDSGYPKGYNHAAQNDVRQAYLDLDHAGPASFPQLLEHVDDDRYSMTVDGGAAEINRSVGFICRWILEKKISPFAYHVAGDGYTRGSAVDGTKVIGPKGDPPARPSFIEHLMKDRKMASEWLIERQTYSLRTIQQEVIEWIIAEEDKDTRKFGRDERSFLKNLLRDLKESDSHIESSRVFLAR